MDITQIRKDFEVWAAKKGLDLDNDAYDLGHYRFGPTDWCWIGWQASTKGDEFYRKVILSLEKDRYDWRFKHNEILLPQVSRLANEREELKNESLQFRKALLEATAALYGARGVLGDAGNIGYAIDLCDAVLTAFPTTESNTDPQSATPTSTPQG